MKRYLLLAAASLLATAAHATTPANSNNSDTTATAAAASSSNATGVGVGVGIGTGGDATANALAAGGSATALNFGGDTSVKTDVRNTNVLGQDQGQQQGQLQGQQQAASASSDQTQAQSLDAHNAQTQSISGNITAASTGASTSASSSAGQQASQTVTVAGDEAQRRNPVSTSYAAPLAIGGGVCAYTPVSAAGQFVSFGLSGSGARIDEGCERRATADVFARIGMTYEACQIMASAKYAIAAGIVCIRPPAPVVTLVVPPPAPVVVVPPAPHVATEAEGEKG